MTASAASSARARPPPSRAPSRPASARSARPPAAAGAGRARRGATPRRRGQPSSAVGRSPASTSDDRPRSKGRHDHVSPHQPRRGLRSRPRRRAAAPAQPPTLTPAEQSSLYSLHQPVVERTNYVLDLAADGDGLSGGRAGGSPPGSTRSALALWRPRRDRRAARLEPARARARRRPGRRRLRPAARRAARR